MIVATAGHIDHGKTTLVKALTGVDTDRLPQEKARGISIDLGFAYAAAAGGQVLAFVDVPGHERFIHNMLAGVAAIDFALLVVAADDGVMPQTREHLHILDLFDIPAGAVALTKVDRVPSGRAEEVSQEVSALLSGTTLAGAPVLPVCAPSGDGLPALHAVLDAAAARWTGRAREGRGFRFAVDRSFSAHGSGTVVTGTVLDGEVAVGDRLVISPAGRAVRVRGLHQREAAVERAVAGERCALNIAGAEPGEAGRGQWLLAPHLQAPTQRLDAWVRVLPGQARPLRHWDPVHVHLGSADVLGRIVLPGGSSLAPGSAGLAHIALERPVAAVQGDRFVLRDASARRTLGGGHVVDPQARPPRQERHGRAERLQALQQGDPAQAWSALLACSPFGAPVQRLRRSFGFTPAAMQALVASCGATLPAGEQGSAFTPGHLRALEAALMDALDAFHRATPHARGQDTDRLLRTALPHVPHREALAILRGLAGRGAVDIEGSLVRMPGHVAAARAGDEQLWQRLQPLYQAWGANVPQLREVALRSGAAEPQLRDFLKHRSRHGEMVRLSAERYLPRPCVADLAAAVVRLARDHAGGEFSIGEFRDATGIGRNLAIEVLEYFDRLGLTRRGGNTRVIRCLDESQADALREPGWRPPRFEAESMPN
jgi:selenocysteine-specific elongation factor